MQLKFFTYFSAIVTAFALPALAADTGTYRPGQPYLAVPASSPDQCEQQCSGDAQCKGWNFVSIQRPPQTICEFNARGASPVPHPMSISGENSSAHDSPRITPIGYRTTRIGKPVVQRRVKPKVQRLGLSQAGYQQQPANTANRLPAYGSRPSPQQIQRPMQAPAQMPQAVNRLKPQLDTFAPPPQATPISVAPAQQPSFKPLLDTVAAAPANAVQPQPNPALAPQAQAPNAPPSLSQLKPGPSTRQADPRLAGPPASVAQAQNSLFGSLYDDVKAPRALTASDIPDDLDAPIPTVSSVPVAQIDQNPL